MRVMCVCVCVYACVCVYLLVCVCVCLCVCVCVRVRVSLAGNTSNQVLQQFSNTEHSCNTTKTKTRVEDKRKVAGVWVFSSYVLKSCQ